MNIRIYQVNMKRDTNNVAFMRYELLEKLQGSQAVNAQIYDKVFDGEVDCQTLEDVYQMLHLLLLFPKGQIGANQAQQTTGHTDRGKQQRYISGNSIPVSAYSTISIGIFRSIIRRSMAVESLPPLRETA